MQKSAIERQENIPVNTPSKKGAVMRSTILLCVLATAIIFAVFFGVLYAYNVFPFSKNCLSQYDLLAQIVPFAEHFFDVVNGRASFFYNTAVGGGMDVFGTVAYCLVSPFSFLFFIFGEGNAYYAASIILPLKLSCIAISAIVFIKLTFTDMPSVFTLPIAIIYAFCGYTFVANTYINWLDFLIYLPLAIPAFSYMRKTGKIRYFALIIALSIYACFSIACFSMFITYPIFVLYAFMVVEHGKRKEYLFQLSLAYLCAIVAALPVLLPALVAFLQSGRGVGIFAGLWGTPTAMPLYRKFTYIVSDTLFVILAVVYFIKTKLATKQSRFLALAGGLIMMPVLVDECCLLLNMGSYLSYSLRFGFLNAVYGLYISCLALQGVKLPKRQSAPSVETNTDGAQNSSVTANAQTSVIQEKKMRVPVVAEGVVFVFTAFLTAFVILIIYELCCIVTNQAGIDFSAFSGLSAFISDMKEQSLNFSSAFAHSIGALEGIAILSGCVAIVVVLVIVLYKFKILRFWLAYPLIALVLLSQTLFYNVQLVDGNIFNPVRYDSYNLLYQRVLEEDDEMERGHYRVKDYNASISDNQPFLTNSSSYSAFSSMIDKTNFAPNIVFGYGSNGVNILKSRGGTAFGDCLLGYKYYSYLSEKNGRLNREYLIEYARERDFIFYENSIVFPSAFTTQNADMGVVCSFNSYFENMQNLYAFLGGEGEVFTTYSIPDKDIAYKTVIDEETGKRYDTIFVKVRLRRSGDYAFYNDLPQDKGIQYFTDKPSNSKPVSEVKTYTYHDEAVGSYYYMYLYCENEGYTLTTQEVQEKCKIKIIDLAKLTALSTTLRQKQVVYQVENTPFTTKYTASVKTQGAGEYLFINSIALKGMTAYVNGRKTQLVDNGLNMMLVPLQVGENDVEIVYQSPYYLYIIISVILAVTLLLLLFILVNKRKKFVKKLHAPVAVASVVLSLAVVIFFMTFPTGVLLYKLIFW